MMFPVRWADEHDSALWHHPAGHTFQRNLHVTGTCCRLVNYSLIPSFPVLFVSAQVQMKQDGDLAAPTVSRSILGEECRVALVELGHK